MQISHREKYNNTDNAIDRGVRPSFCICVVKIFVCIVLSLFSATGQLKYSEIAHLIENTIQNVIGGNRILEIVLSA